MRSAIQADPQYPPFVLDLFELDTLDFRLVPPLVSVNR